jgi:hypothetical protein
VNDIETLTTFFGWCTVVNLGIYLFTVFAVTMMRDFAFGINAKMFAISKDDIARVTFQYIGAYKLLITVLFLTPYLALKIMA